jgi:hypothetical protein
VQDGGNYVLENRQGTMTMTVTVQGPPLRVSGLPHPVQDATIHVTDVGGAITGRRGVQPGRAHARLWCTPPQERRTVWFASLLGSDGEWWACRLVMD